MRAVIIYRDTDDTYPDVRNWLADFRRQYPSKIVEEYSPDDVKIDDLLLANDINQFPVILALNNGSEAVAVWADEMLPRLGDVAYYAAEKDESPGSKEFAAQSEHLVIEPPKNTSSDTY